MDFDVCANHGNNVSKANIEATPVAKVSSCRSGGGGGGLKFGVLDLST